MNESDIEKRLVLAEATLSNIDSRNLFTQQVQNFGKILMEIIVSSEACALIEKMREDLLSLPLEFNQPLSQTNVIRFHFTLGRLNFLLDAQKQARVHFREAARYGLPPDMAYYNLAMTYAADIDLEDDERKTFTKGFLQMIVDSEGLDSDPGREAALHIRLIEWSDFL